MKIKDAKSVKLAIRRGYTVKLLAKQMDISEGEVETLIQRMYPVDYRDVLKQLEKNEKKPSPKIVRDKPKQVEECTLNPEYKEEVYTEDDEAQGSVLTMQELEKEEKELSQICVELENKHKEMIFLRRNLSNALREKAMRLENLSKEFQQLKEEITESRNQFRSIAEEMIFNSREWGSTNSLLVEVRNDIKTSKTIKILVLDDCQYSIEQNGADLTGVRAGNSEEIQREKESLLKLSIAEDLTIRQIALIAKLKVLTQDMSKNNELYTIEFEGALMKEVFDL